MQKNGAEEGSLFPACSLQGAVQLQRIARIRESKWGCEPEEARNAVSKDGAACPSCFETPRHSVLRRRVNALKARLLSMRAGEGGAAWPEPLYARSTNLWVYKMGA